MKVTHRRPVKDWYIDRAYMNIDYPVFAGYIHYLMAYVYKFYDPEGFRNQVTVGDIKIYKPEIKLGVKRAVLALNVLTYYPIVIAVVLLHFRKGFTRVFKLATIFCLAAFPAHAYNEFVNTQANGPHLGLLLLCFYCLAHDHFSFATICFTLSFTYKHNIGPLVFPIGLYILSREWYLLSAQVFSDTDAKSINRIRTADGRRPPYFA